MRAEGTALGTATVVVVEAVRTKISASKIVEQIYESHIFEVKMLILKRDK